MAATGPQCTGRSTAQEPSQTAMNCATTPSSTQIFCGGVYYTAVVTLSRQIISSVRGERLDAGWVDEDDPSPSTLHDVLSRGLMRNVESSGALST